MERRRYGTSPLAQARKAAGLTQEQACKLVGLKNKQHLSQIENGRVMASTGIMKLMVTAYEISQTAVLKAATDTFETGVTLQRHRRRQLKVASLGRK